MKLARHEHCEAPHGNSIVWRYMDIEKFFDLVVNGRLYFTNGDSFTDEYEMTVPENTVHAKRKELAKTGLSGRDLEETLAPFEYRLNSLRGLTFVNCWSLGTTESYALWKIYLGGSRAGVAVRTSFSNVIRAIEQGKNPDRDNFYAGKVTYRNFLPLENLSRFRLITTKQEFYEYEKEVRLFILGFRDKPEEPETDPHAGAGRFVSVDVDELLTEIYLSPFVAPWFEKTFRRMVKGVAPRIEARICSSSIRDK